MFRKLLTRRGGAVLATTAIGIAGMSLAFSGTAGAAPPNASLLIGSGSQTSYSTMISLTDLFNTSPGLRPDRSRPRLPLSENCGTTSFTAGAAQGEQGFIVGRREPLQRLLGAGSSGRLGQRSRPAGSRARLARSTRTTPVPPRAPVARLPAELHRVCHRRCVVDDVQQGRWHQDQPGQGQEHQHDQPQGHLERHAVLHGQGATI